MGKFYIVTAIPYVNAEPHLGHALEFIQADVLARYHRQRGDDVLFSTGADEHGSKVFESAQKAKKDPQQFVDEVSSTFQNLCKVLDISNDRFIRTSSPAHKKSAQQMWQKLEKDIYKGKYSGLYCTGCEEFVTAEHAKQNKNVCPIHKKPYQKLEEENYFFKLSRYTEPVKKAVESDKFQVTPVIRKHEILEVLKKGLEDISISRPKDKLPWGVPVPNDDTQVMYVWFEALMNYVSTLGYPDGADFKKYWPADVQIIGKDILRFHAAVWPAMLLAAGVALPKTLYVHGFISVEGQKMSKSIGNVIDPIDTAKKYGSDVLRYYLLREIPGDGDGDFSWQRFSSLYYADLANDLGNLVQRTVAMVRKYQDGVIGAMPKHSHDVKPYTVALQTFRFDKALEEIWLLIRGLNQYIEEEKPWKIASKDQEHLREILAYLAANILQVAQLLVPFMPATAEQIQQLFGEGLIKKDSAILFPKREDADEPG